MQEPIDEQEELTGSGLPESRAPRPTPTGRGPGALLTLAGLGMTAAGTALAALPRFAPQFDWTVRNLASEGVMGGTFAAGGLVLIGLGLAARAQSRFFRAASERSDADLMLEHLSGELTNIRSEINDTNLRLLGVRDETRGLFEAVQARDAMESQENEQRDATFRMAASLDQLGARIDQRMQSRDASFEQVFGELRQQLADVRTLAEELRTTIEQAPEVTETSAGYDAPPSLSYEASPSLSHEASPAMATEIAPAIQVETGPPQGLDLLESLDQQTEIKASLSDQPQGSIEYRPIAVPDLADGAPPAPLPQQGGSPAPLSLTMQPSESPLPVGDERLEEIRTLLADERVRDALQL